MTQSEPAARRRVLVVDDSADLAESMAASLELLAFEARCCGRGTEALRIMAEWLPEIVFLDLTLPGSSGIDVLQSARRTDWGRGIMMIAMTGWSADAQRDIALAAGFDVFVEKPFDLEVLRPLLAPDNTARLVNQSFD